MSPLGLYLSVPFCRSKCSYCNFASDVFAERLRAEYVRLLVAELELAAAEEELAGAEIDTIYWGGGTPSLLEAEEFQYVLAAVRRCFRVLEGAEHTVEAAPGTIADGLLQAWVEGGVNRVSLGVQSFIDAEARAVGRLQTRAVVLEDFRRLRRRGLAALGADLIAGLPHQSEASWRESLEVALRQELPHLSVYMLEVDEESRLGNELLAGGRRYHAHHVPDEDLVAQFHELACDRLEAAGVRQYEISNFARPGWESRHNRRYWQRRPYLGLGVDAHSMLVNGGVERRLANADRLDAYMQALRAGRRPLAERREVLPVERVEETLFLGLRCREGVDPESVRQLCAECAEGAAIWRRTEARVNELRAEALLFSDPPWRLTRRGRMLSNTVFAELLVG